MTTMLSDDLLANKERFFSETPVALFHRAAGRYPDKAAICSEKYSMTYRELDQKSDALADYLVNHEQIGRDEVIAFSVGRGPEALIAILGIWKAGAAYVALDPLCPAEHTRRCLEVGKVRICIHDDYLIRVLENAAKDVPFTDRSKRDHLALIIFTSGSTGKPKGVRILHANISASISSYDVLHLRSNDVFASFASLVFIASVYDIAVSLALGCTLYFVPETIRRDIHKLAAFYIKHQVTVTFLPPHMACKYIEIDTGSPLHLLLVGSEPVRNLKKRNYDIINVYASSEACAVISHYRVKDERAAYPIGEIVPSLRGYIVGDDGQPVPDGAEGELWLSGPQIFDGYVGLPELNRTRILQNPFEKADHRFEKVFKTSDIVRRRNGVLEYICRKDTMYKIRGFRVEASCVELCLLQYPGIKEASAVCFEDAGGTNILFGYFIANNLIEHHALRKWLSGQLPYYAVPTGLVQVDHFPRTLSGKVDRKGFQPPKKLNDHKLLGELYF